jgi:AraC family transcriptional regulator, transcriptional activator of the genes for pyochelin and ferripyochelin receptors
MAITFSQADYNELWHQCNPTVQPDQPSDGAETITVVPPHLGQGHIRSIALRGMALSIFDYQLHDDVFIKDSSAGTEWEFGFNISGNRSGKRTSENFIGWGCWESEVTYETYADDAILKVDIHLQSADQLHTLIGDELDGIAPEIRQLIEEQNQDFFDDINIITPAMRSALEQILNCPFTGKTKQIYLESKCLELIALKLEQFKSGDRYTRPPMCSLAPDDVDRIYLARDIITEQSDNPPSLMQLARQVGLNDFKLKLGFRQIFGTTVFGYVHRHRMEMARQLLSDRRMNVKEVAQTVGYANQSRFAVAFRKQFGINPKAYLLSKKSG